MPMGDNIREEEQAKVDGLRAVNRMLREQNRVLREALEGYAYCSDGCTCGDGWSHDAANAALTATSQEGQHG